MYIDEVILLNFIIDYIILKTLKYLLKINSNKFRIIISSIVGELSVILFFISLNNMCTIIFKIVLSILMIYIAFGFNDIKSFIQNIVYYFILNFFLGGILFYFKNNGIIQYKYFLLLIPLIMNIYKKFSYNLKTIFSLKHKVTVYLNNGKILYLNGYMDSANCLIEPYNNRKVIIINKKVSENFYLVPYKTINDYSLLKCFNPKKVYIDGIGERNDISIGVVDKKFVGFNCLLNYKLMEDIC